MRFLSQLALIIRATIQIQPQALHKLRMLRQILQNLPMKIPKILIQVQKILVVYYSATGSTKAVAETIADTSGADLFEITPVDPYTSDDLNWTNDNSRVSVEHNDESKRDVPLTKTTPDNWADYDTVFIGYPIWWGIAAWPVNNFVKGNDFSGKTVIPFCTSSSSGLGQSGDLLADMAGTGDWQDGERFSSGASSSKVESWVSGLDLK